MNIVNSQITWKLETKCLIALPVALRHFNRIVHICHLHRIVCHVAHRTQSASSLEVAGQCGRYTGPNFDPRTISSISHRDVVHVDILDQVNLPCVLA